MFFFAFIGLFHSFCKIVRKNHLMFHSPGSTTYHLASVQQARAFGVLLLEFERVMQ
jgi:hypothetical protein